MVSFIKKICFIVVFSLIACTAVSGGDSMDDLVKVKINDEVFDVKLENNSATQNLIKERYNATHDRLTGLYNKEYFFEVVHDVKANIFC